MKTILNFGENADHLFDILYLSYSYLPVHLKPCFLYMGVFPEDDKVYVSSLTWLWIAEGFLKPKDGQTLEEVAEGCLNDLIGRNLILVDDWSLKKKSEKCGIHDVLRELCIKIAEKEKFFCVFDTSRSIQRERRVVVNTKEIQHVLKSAPLVRSQLKWERCRVSFDSKLIRVVITKDEESFCQEALEDFRGDVSVNLRFLQYSFRQDGIFYTNSSISLLWNLQTLIVRGGLELKSAPYGFWEMTQLRHLQCDYVFLPDPLPSDELDEANDMVLRNLQTLELAVNLRLSDEICKRIPNIKELYMTYSNSLKKCDKPCSYYPHNLGRLHKLELLQCCIQPQGREWHEFAQALTFPSSLKKLTLWCVHLDWEEITMKIGSLPLLEVLHLAQVKGGAEWNPVEGGFPCLRSLEIEGSNDLTNWNVESSHFPVLEHLSLEGLSKLDELPCDIGEIPTLQRIHLRACSLSLDISALRIVVEQEENGNESLQLHVHFWHNESLESFNKIIQEEGLTSNNLQLFVD